MACFRLVPLFPFINRFTHHQICNCSCCSAANCFCRQTLVNPVTHILYRSGNCPVGSIDTRTVKCGSKAVCYGQASVRCILEANFDSAMMCVRYQSQIIPKSCEITIPCGSRNKPTLFLSVTSFRKGRSKYCNHFQAHNHNVSRKIANSGQTDCCLGLDQWTVQSVVNVRDTESVKGTGVDLN
jgi:hypothetical protein